MTEHPVAPDPSRTSPYHSWIDLPSEPDLNIGSVKLDSVPFMRCRTQQSTLSTSDSRLARFFPPSKPSCRRSLASP